MTWTIRNARAEDAPALADLTKQLGYTADAAFVAGRLSPLFDHRDHAIFVAEADGKVIGWVHVYLSPVFYGLSSEIGGLVVDQAFRGQGIGKALMTRCEEWARNKGIPEIRLRSGSHRAEAHQFYEAIGYHVVKQQKVFVKQLGGK